MKLKLALLRDSGSPVDIVVTADAMATVEDVARSIVETDPFTRRIPDPNTRLTLKV